MGDVNYTLKELLSPDGDDFDMLTTKEKHLRILNIYPLQSMTRGCYDSLIPLPSKRRVLQMHIYYSRFSWFCSNHNVLIFRCCQWSCEIMLAFLLSYDGCSNDGCWWRICLDERRQEVKIVSHLTRLDFLAWSNKKVSIYVLLHPTIIDGMV